MENNAWAMESIQVWSVAVMNVISIWYVFRIGKNIGSDKAVASATALIFCLPAQQAVHGQTLLQGIQGFHGGVE